MAVDLSSKVVPYLGDTVVVFRGSDVVAGVVIRNLEDHCTLGVPRCDIGIPIRHEDILDVKPLSLFCADRKDLEDIRGTYGEDAACDVSFAYDYYVGRVYAD